MARFDPIAPPAAVVFIGLGNMGQPMALNLRSAGYRVIGFDVAPRAMSAFAQAGGETAEDVTAVSAAAAIVTMLPNGKIGREVVNRLYSGCRPGTIIIDMSSSQPLETRRLGEDLARHDLVLVDAPVSGGVKRARDGSLAIMAGGEARALDAIEPILRAMGKSIFRTGPLGSGHAMKALNNYVSGAGLIAAIEAVEIGRRFGLAPSLMVDVLNASTGRNNSTENKLTQHILSETFASGFSLALMAKDIRTADDLARQLDVTAPLADHCAALWDAAAAKAEPGADHTEVWRYLDGAAKMKRQ